MSTHFNHYIYMCVFHLPSSSYRDQRSMLLIKAAPLLLQWIPSPCTYSMILVQQLTTCPLYLQLFPSELSL